MTSLAHRLNPAREGGRASRSQERWPTVRWAVGELRWYLVGILFGMGSFAAGVLVYIAQQTAR